jgi:hypothetical protein
VTNTSPNLIKTIIHIGTHNHVVDDSDIKTFDNKIKEMIKKVVHKKTKASLDAMVIRVVENIIMEKVTMSSRGPYFDDKDLVTLLGEFAIVTSSNIKKSY